MSALLQCSPKPTSRAAEGGGGMRNALKPSHHSVWSYIQMLGYIQRARRHLLERRGRGEGKERKKKHTRRWGRNRSLKMLEWRKKKKKKWRKRKKKESRQLDDMQVWRGRRQDARWWQWWWAWPLIPDGAMERSVRVEEEENTTRLFQKKNQNQKKQKNNQRCSLSAQLHGRQSYWSPQTTTSMCNFFFFSLFFFSSKWHSSFGTGGMADAETHTHTRENTRTESPAGRSARVFPLFDLSVLYVGLIKSLCVVLGFFLAWINSLMITREAAPLSASPSMRGLCVGRVITKRGNSLRSACPSWGGWFVCCDAGPLGLKIAHLGGKAALWKFGDVAPSLVGSCDCSKCVKFEHAVCFYSFCRSSQFRNDQLMRALE